MVPSCTPLGLHPCVYAMSLKTDHIEPSVLSQPVMSVPAVWKSAEQISKIQETQRISRTNRREPETQQIGELGLLTGFACFAAGGPVLWGWATDPSCGEQLYCAPGRGGGVQSSFCLPPPPRLNNEL